MGKSSGLDIDLGNRCSQIAYGWAKKTFANREPGTGNPLMNVDGGFANVMDFGGVKIGMSSDGIGTKIELAERTGIYHTLGFDLIAMVADDLAANGLETVNLSNILDVDFLDAQIVDELMRGLHDAANFAQITITGGEIAELGDRIGGWGDRMHFNWGATGIGILPEGQHIIDGSQIETGDLVVALKSRGFRSNGFSLIRRIMQERFGDEWHNQPYDGSMTWGEKLLTPSLIFSPLIAALRKAGSEIHGIAHITGGGLPDNLQRILKPRYLGAALTDLFEPLEVMLKLQELGQVEDEKAYRLWNMGNGMVLIVPPAEADSVIRKAMEDEYQAKICGVITAQTKITIHSLGRGKEILNVEWSY